VIAGLDISLTSTGWSCGDVVTTVGSSFTGAERLHDIREKLLDLVRRCDYPGVVLEGYSFASKTSRAHAIGELGGVLRLSLWEMGIPFVEIPPTVRAKFATGKGNAGKNEVISAISARTGIVWSGKGADDQCDAFILEEIGLAALGMSRYEWPKENRQILDKYDWTELEVWCAAKRPDKSS